MTISRETDFGFVISDSNVAIKGGVGRSGVTKKLDKIVFSCHTYMAIKSTFQTGFFLVSC